MLVICLDDNLFRYRQPTRFNLMLLQRHWMIAIVCCTYVKTKWLLSPQMTVIKHIICNDFQLVFQLLVNVRWIGSDGATTCHLIAIWEQCLLNI